MKWIDYREKLGIGFDDNQKFILLKNKTVVFTRYLSGKLGAPDFIDFSFINYFITVCETPKNSNLWGVSESFEESQSMQELISKFVAFSNTAESHINNQKAITLIKKLLQDSLTALKIPFETIKDDDGVFFLPKGAKELDDALVSQPLEWLKEYPQARESFAKALKKYAEFTDNNASEVADSFRKALESFFQNFFGCNKSLENMMSEYGTFLKNKGVPKEISNDFVKLIDSYTKFNNNYAKHHDNASKNILEYIMYQTGNIIRLLVTLSKN